MCKYILIVDDDIYLAHAIQFYLSSKEKKIFTVDNVVAAIKLLRLYSFHLIISDVMMVSYSGYDLLYYLRLSNNFSRIPFIILTAKGMTFDRIKGYDLGCNAYLAKPFHPSELFSLVNNLLYSSISYKGPAVKKKSDHKEANTFKFTVRELSVLQLLAKGMTNKEIAIALFLSIRNVEKYVSRLLNKTQTRNRTELAKFFLSFSFDLLRANDGTRTRD